MKIPHDRFCVLPWISLEASPIGTVRPCCLSRKEITDDRGTKFSLGENDLDTIRNSQYMQHMRAAFLRGDQPSDCDRCWSEETAGRTSKRMHTLERLKHIVTDEEWSPDSKPLMFLDLKLGNICNLKCRICGSWSSSTFAAEEIGYQKDRKNNFHYVMLQMGRWPRNADRFWNNLERHISGLKYLEFTGGEPFMINEHFALLEKLVERGHAEDIEIHYNTNGTIFPMGAEKIWKHFRQVEIAFSIDDVGERFEYQRSNARWHEVNGHIDLFREMRARNRNITLQVCCTVNVYNVGYLADVAQWITQQNFDFVYWNMLHDPPQLNIGCLPPQAKQDISSTLLSSDIPLQFQKDMQGVIDFMMQGTSSTGHDTRQHIANLDRRRRQSLHDVAPELAKILNYQGPDL